MLPVVNVLGDHVCGRGTAPFENWLECRTLKFTRIPAAGVRTKVLTAQTQTGYDVQQLALNSKGDRLYTLTQLGPIIQVYNIDSNSLPVGIRSTGGRCR